MRYWKKNPEEEAEYLAQGFNVLNTPLFRKRNMEDYNL